MTRRKHNHYVRCAHEGCKEVLWSQYSTYKEYNKAVERTAKSPPWYCYRHNGGNLNMDVLKREGEKIMECKPGDGIVSHRHFWDGFSGLVNSVTSAIEWSAVADDFPIGSKLVIRTSVEIILPEQEPTPAYTPGQSGAFDRDWSGLTIKPKERKG